MLVGKTGLWDGRFDAVAASYTTALKYIELEGDELTNAEPFKRLRSCVPLGLHEHRLYEGQAVRHGARRYWSVQHQLEGTQGVSDRETALGASEYVCRA